MSSSVYSEVMQSELLRDAFGVVSGRCAWGGVVLAGFSWFRPVSGRFGWFRVIPLFSNYVLVGQ